MSKKSQAWQSYEEIAAYLLNQIAAEFGLKRFEGKQIVQGKRSKTKWEIDAKGVGNDNEIFFIVECRRYTTSRQNQDKLGGLAYRIIDTGADGGILVSPLGLQEGASRIAQAENIYSVTLDANSTTIEYILKFLEKTRYGKDLRNQISFKSTLNTKIIQKDKSIEDLGEI